MELLQLLKNTKKDLLKNFGIKELALFGSYARGDFTKESDIDLAILDIDKKDYFIRAEAKYYLENLLHKKVDLGYFDSIRPFIRRQVKNEMIHV
jgi:predicted nucleotidyltransferase